MKHFILFSLFIAVNSYKSFAQPDFFSTGNNKIKPVVYGFEASGVLTNGISYYEVNGYRKNIGWHPRPTVHFIIESTKGSIYRWGLSAGVGYDKHDFNFNDFTAEEEKYVSFELLRTQLMLTNTSRVGKYTFFKLNLGGAYNFGLNERIYSPSAGKISSKNNIGNSFSLATNAALYVKVSPKLYIGLTAVAYKDLGKGVELLDNKVKISRSALGLSILYKFQ